MCSDSFPSCPTMDPVSQEVSDLSENLHQGDGRFTQGHNRDLCEASPAQRNCTQWHKLVDNQRRQHRWCEQHFWAQLIPMSLFASVLTDTHSPSSKDGPRATGTGFLQTSSHLLPPSSFSFLKKGWGGVVVTQW